MWPISYETSLIKFTDNLFYEIRKDLVAGKVKGNKLERPLSFK